MNVETAVQLENVSKSYGGQTVVTDVSFDVRKGEFLTLLGSSGSGKTTTLMMIAGFAKPDSGRIRLSGKLINDLPPEKRGLGVVFQSYALFPHMSVQENVAFPLKMRGRPSAETRERVRAALDVVSLGDYAERRIQQISGGQQQRVALARALVFEPPVLLMDEPLGALDRLLREQLQSEIKRIQKTFNLTIVYVTHDQDEALSMSDRIAVMSEGRILQIGSPDEVYESPATAFVAGFLGESNFIEGSVTFEGGRAVLAPSVDPTLRFEARESGIGDGATAKGVIRPEALHLVAPGQTFANVLEGRILERDYLGNCVKLRVDTPVGPLLVRAPREAASSARRLGDPVKLGWRSADMLLLRS